MFPLRLSTGLLTLVAIAGIGTHGGAAAAQGVKARFLEQSLASHIVQQMAQRRIFEADDRADAVCQEKELLQAAVVREPSVERVGSVDMRNWQEDWTLRRCEKKVAYRVFYNEIGAGGVTVSVAAHDAAGAAAPSVVALAKAKPELLSLQQPPLRGEQVARIQKALSLAGYKVKADGVFGQGTHGAVMRFQQAKGLTPSGNIDEKTREALGLM